MVSRSHLRFGQFARRLLSGSMFTAAAVVIGSLANGAPPKDQTYMPVVPTQSFEETLKQDSADKDKVMSDQKALLEKRYDLRDDPSKVQMSGKRKAVQQGVR